MSRNQAEDFAQRLYARVPSNYRVYDVDRGQSLLALMRVVGAQVANLRQDLDALWDNFFIETCDDWIVPYIGALVNANLVSQPVGQSNRLDVWNTVIWRRSKGTPEMLGALARAISGWPSDLNEFFLSLGWSQNLNHVRADRPLTPDLRDPAQLALLGKAADPFAHAADFKPARPLDSPRIKRNSNGIGDSGWTTPGRYQIPNLGIFVRRLQTFPVSGGTPASAPPGSAAPAAPGFFTFNPLFRDAPLFAAATGSPISHAEFAADPWASFGLESDIAVREFGVLLATETAPSVGPTSSSTPFAFGGLSPTTLSDMRLLQPRSFQLGAAHFLITAKWQQGNNPGTNIGFLSTMFAASGGQGFQAGAAGTGAGQLVITVQTGRNGLGWLGPALPASPAARFPGAVLAVRAARAGALHSHDGLYIYLPSSFLRPGDAPLTYFVADDGSTYTSPGLGATSLARSSEGQVYPARSADPSAAAAEGFLRLNRRQGMVLTDPSRFAGASILLEAAVFTGSASPQTLGGIATTNQTPAVDTSLQAPNPWPAFTFAPSKAAVAGTAPSTGLLSVVVRPLSGNFIPAAEIVLVNRSGQSLLVYLPEVQAATAAGVKLLVADDGSTYFLPGDAASQQSVLSRQSFVGLVLARAAQGQVLPIPGRWPLQQRRPVALNLCRSERSSMVLVGELGIDPELGRFALPPNDPSIALTSPPQPALSQSTLEVDFVEAFTSFVGAVNSTARQLGSGIATRFVSRSGDADNPKADSLNGAPVHASVSDAVANAKDGDVIEIVDSATYNASASIALPASITSLTIRAAAGQRPCLTFYRPGGAPADASFAVRSPMSALALNGLLVGGGPLTLASPVAQLNINGCTLDPLSSGFASLVATDSNLNSNASYVLTSCVTGGLRVGQGVGQLTIADSIVDQQGGAAIAGASGPSSPPASPPASVTSAAQVVQLERVTVFGSIFCNVLIASDSLLNDLATVNDRQSGCLRFTRFENGSVLPRRYRCLPNDAQAGACTGQGRCLAPLFQSRRFGRPDYAQLAAACPNSILTAGEDQGEVGAFAGAQNTLRLRNLNIKLQEFMPMGLSAVIIAEN
jgi:hypothetical protein